MSIFKSLKIGDYDLHVYKANINDDTFISSTATLEELRNMIETDIIDPKKIQFFKLNYTNKGTHN